MIHSTLSPFEKRTLERELKALGLPSNMALAATRVASKHMDVAMEVRRREWVAFAALLAPEEKKPCK